MHTTDAHDTTRPTRGRRLLAAGSRGFAVVGLLAVTALLVGFVADVAAIDRTRGGYEPPYTGSRGEPIDWDAQTYTSATGMVATGYVMDVHTDCTSGMIRFEIMGLFTVDYRELSDRAIAVHRPRQACEARGFTPGF